MKNIFVDITSFFALTEYVTNNKLSGFQSHLLVYKGNPVFVEDAAKELLSEAPKRRVFLLFEDKKFGFIDFDVAFNEGIKYDMIHSAYICSKIPLFSF